MSKGKLELTAIDDLPLPAGVTVGRGTIYGYTHQYVVTGGRTGLVQCAVKGVAPGLLDVDSGDLARIDCRNGVLVRVTRFDAAPAGRIEMTSSLFEVTPTVVGFDDYSCQRTRRSPPLGRILSGDTVRAVCDDGVLTSITYLRTAARMWSAGFLANWGVVSHVDARSITVVGENTYTCLRGPDSPDVDELPRGRYLHIACLRRVVTGVVVSDVAFRDFREGTIVAASDSAVTIRADVNRMRHAVENVTCTRGPLSPKPNQFPVGEHVKLACAFLGDYREDDPVLMGIALH